MSKKDAPEGATDTNPARAEVTGADLTFDHEGRTWTIPRGDDWPMEAGVAWSEIADSADNPMRSTKYVREFVRILLGPRQWGQFVATRPTTKALVEMYQAILNATGSSAGE